jgi:hypothetical protein
LFNPPLESLTILFLFSHYIAACGRGRGVGGTRSRGTRFWRAVSCFLLAVTVKKKKKRNTYGIHALCGLYLAYTNFREGVWLGACKVFVSRHPSSALCKVEDAGYQKQVFQYFSSIDQACRLVWIQVPGFLGQRSAGASQDPLMRGLQMRVTRCRDRV